MSRATSCIPIQVQVERVFIDFYYTFRAWLNALKYTLPSRPQLESLLCRYPHLFSHVLCRLLNLIEIDRLVLEGMLNQFIHTLLRIARDIQISASIEEAYLHLKDLSKQLAEFIHERAPEIRRAHLIELFCAFAHSLRTEMCFTLSSGAELVNSFDAAYQSLASLRHLLNYMLYQVR